MNEMDRLSGSLCIGSTGCVHILTRTVRDENRIATCSATGITFSLLPAGTSADIHIYTHHPTLPTQRIPSELSLHPTQTAQRHQHAPIARTPLNSQTTHSLPHPNNHCCSHWSCTSTRHHHHCITHSPAHSLTHPQQRENLTACWTPLVSGASFTPVAICILSSRTVDHHLRSARLHNVAASFSSCRCYVVLLIAFHSCIAIASRLCRAVIVMRSSKYLPSVSVCRPNHTADTAVCTAPSNLHSPTRLSANCDFLHTLY